MSTFVGREHELGRLLAGLDDALDGRGRLFLVGGEPGIGKSRLADELTETARERSASVLVGRCWEAGGAPAFWPWVQALRTRLRERDLEALRAELGIGAPYVAQIVPELHELLPGLSEPPALESEGARFQLFDAVTSFLRRTSEPQGVVLVLDDLHVADEPSLLLLRFVARELSGSHLLVLAAYRDVDPTVSGPLSATLAEVVGTPATEALELTGLGAEEVARFIEVTTGRPPDAELASAVYTGSEGNPLFAGEIVRLLTAERGLDARLVLPQTVKEVIGRRLHHLSEECNRVLGVASVLGREFDFDVVERVSGLEADVLLGLLDEAMAARVVSELPGSVGRLRFAHQLIRDTLYESLATVRRRQLHLELGEAIEALHAADLDPHLAELALHFFNAAPVAGSDRAIDYARHAGERAVRLLAYEEAVRVYELALTLVASELDRCELLLAIGDAQARAGDTPTAKNTYREAAELAERLGLAEQLARAALGYGGRLIWEVSRDDEHLVPLLEKGLSALGDGDNPLRVRLLARLAGGPLRDTSFAAVRRKELSSEALEIARRLGDPATLAYALSSYIHARHSPEFTHEQIEVAMELVRVATEAGDVERAFDGHDALLLAYAELGQIGQAKAALDEMDRLARELRQPAHEWYEATDRILLVLLQGRLTEAEELIFGARSLGEHTQAWSAVVSFRLQLYVLRWEQGRLAELEDLVRDSVREYPTYPIWRCVLAHLESELGRKDEARRLLDTELPFDEEWLVGMGFLAEAAASVGDSGAAGVLYDQLLPYADRVAVSYPEIATGSVSRYLGLLAATMGRRDDAERHFQDALAVHKRIGAETWFARTQRNLAELLPADDAAPLGLAGYRIEAELARGGMGVVHRATDVRLQRPVALKVIAPELAEDLGFRERFLSESRLAASLDHPNVVPIYEAGDADGQLFIAMRYVAGSDLKTLLVAERQLTAERALAVCGQVAAALDAAHAKDLVHRDVKPGNVLLDEREHAYLADFGLTKQAGGASTRSGRLIGTLDYLAPEQIRGDELDGRTDQYALACVLHECLSGAPPFRRQTEAELLWAHMHEQPPPLRDQPELDPIVARALAKEKDERYLTCGDFIDAAREAVGLETPRLRRRRRLIWRSRALIVAGALLLAGGIAAAVVELSGGSAAIAGARPNSVAVIDPRTNALVSDVSVGSAPSSIAGDASGVWALNADDQTVSRIDPSSLEVARTLSVGSTPTDLAVGADSVWVADGPQSTLTRVDPASGFVLRTIRLPRLGPTPGLAVAVGNGGVWAAREQANVVRVDPATNAVTALIRSLNGGGSPGGAQVTVGAGAVWVSDGSGLVTKIDSGTNAAVDSALLGGGSGDFGDIATGLGAVWVSDTGNDRVWEIDPGPAAVSRTFTVGTNPVGLAVGDGSVWTANSTDGTVSRIDPVSGRVTTIRIGGTPHGITVSDGRVWVTVD